MWKVVIFCYSLFLVNIIFAVALATLISAIGRRIVLNVEVRIVM